MVRGGTGLNDEPWRAGSVVCGALPGTCRRLPSEILTRRVHFAPDIYWSEPGCAMQ